MAESSKPVDEGNRLWAILKRAQDARAPLTRINEIARLAYHGSPDVYDIYVPPAFWNNFRTICLNTAGMLVSGEPKPSIRIKPGKDELANAASWVNEGVAGVLSRSSFRAVLTNFILDVPRYGGGWMYLDDDDIVEYCSWFDCYADNALGKACDPYRTSRYFFKRFLWDKKRFKDVFSIDPEKDVGESTGSNESSDLPGRQIGGIDVFGRRALMKEESTELSPAHNLPLPGSSDGGDAKASILNDGLVEWWRSFEYDAADKTWTVTDLYGGKVIGTPRIISNYEEFPPLFTMQYDDDGEQFYSPGEFVHTEKNQRFINHVLHRFARQLETVTDPPVINPLNSGLDDNDAARLIDSGKEIRPATKDSAPYYPDLPQAPAWWFNLIDVMFKVTDDSSGQTEVLSGNKPDSSTSGVAIRQLAELGSTRRKSLPIKRDEVLRDLGRRITVRLVEKAYAEAQQKMEVENQAVEEQNASIRESNELRAAVGDTNFEIEMSTSPLADFLPEGLKIYEDQPTGEVDASGQEIIEPVLKGLVTVDQVRNDLIFDFEITPPLTREDQYSALITAISTIHPIVMTMFPLSPMFAVLASVRIAALATSTQDIADEVESELLDSYKKAGEAMQLEADKSADDEPEEEGEEGDDMSPSMQEKVKRSAPAKPPYDPSKGRGY